MSGDVRQLQTGPYKPWFRAIARAAGDISDSLELEHILQHLADSIGELLACDHVGISLTDPSTRTVVLRAQHTTYAQRAPRGFSQQYGEGLIGRAAAEGRAILANDVSAAEGYRVFYKPETRAELCVPIRFGQEVIGVIDIQSRRQDFFAAEVLPLLELLADQAATAITIAQLLAERTHQQMLETYLKDQEAVLSDILRHATDGILLTNPHGRIRAWNRGAEQILGYTSEEMQGKEISDLLAELDRQRLAVLGAELGQKPHVVGFEIRLQTREGTPVTVEANISQVRRGDSVIGYSAVFRDVTAQKDLQAHMARMERLHALGEMAAGFAHEFNNLLASILGRIELLLPKSMDPEVQRSLTILRNIALDGAALIGRLQGFSQVPDKEQVTTVNVNSLIEEALQVTEPKLTREMAARGLPLHLEVALPEVPPVRGVPPQLREVFVNLIINALDAMPQGGSLAIRTGKDQDGVTVAIQDSGTGLDPGVRERIFEPFFTTKGERGSGLGLSIAYGIVTRHGGEIMVASEPGHGCTFTVRLPAADKPAAPEPAVCPAPTPAAPGKALVVDDEEPVATILCLLLEECGHRAVRASSGQEGLSLLLADDFDLVFTDLGMPGMSGWEVAAEIKKSHPQLPVILVTGWNLNLTPRELRSRGVDYLLKKPFSISQVAESVVGARAPTC